ncbi:phage tail protein [Paenibacillus dauci]|uniref:phage tail protein n=1 Tax=Paenibacillus dauci TaxID=1567106 RepID=UPI000619F90E|nr:tail fiber protein [Paenibacillus dauci]
MADPFIGEIKLFAINFTPSGWLACDGQVLPINTNTALFAVIGTTFGGDGRTNFQLPDLRGRVALHPNSSIPSGTSQGEAAHTLTLSELPQHTHSAMTSTATANQTKPANQLWAKGQPLMYAPVGNLTPTAMNPGTLTPTGGNTAHSNIQPYQTVQFCIAVQGTFPMRP